MLRLFILRSVRLLFITRNVRSVRIETWEALIFLSGSCHAETQNIILLGAWGDLRKTKVE